MIKTWSPVLDEFEKRIPLINQLGTMWGKLQSNMKKGVYETPTKEQMKVREKLVTNVQSELPSNLPVIGVALANAIGKLSGNDKAIMLTDTEFLGSMLNILGKGADILGGVKNFFSGDKKEKDITPDKKTREKRSKLTAPNL